MFLQTLYGSLRFLWYTVVMWYWVTARTLQLNKYSKRKKLLRESWTALALNVQEYKTVNSKRKGFKRKCKRGVNICACNLCLHERCTTTKKYNICNNKNKGIYVSWGMYRHDSSGIENAAMVRINVKWI